MKKRKDTGNRWVNARNVVTLWPRNMLNISNRRWVSVVRHSFCRIGHRMSSSFLCCKLWLLVLVLGAGFGRVQAQQDVAFQQYWRVETLWNPAAVGRSPQLSINGAVQTHASGFSQAGSTMWAGADMAFRFGETNHGVGASFLNDEIGLFSHKRFALQYAYHHRIWGGRLSIGVQADMLQEDLDGSRADLGTGNDPAFPSSKVNGSAFDASLGLHFERGPLRVGASALHLLAPTVEMGETYRMEVKRLLNLSTAYNIATQSPLFTITPSAMLRTDLSDYRLDLTLRGNYSFEKRHLYGGINYAPGRSVGLFVGGTLRGVDITYGYEANTSGMGVGAGQHEVTIGYKMDLNLGRRTRNLHKSVRWL